MSEKSIVAIAAICLGEPREAMEAAKYLISKPDMDYSTSLEMILANKKAKPWSRIASSYVLGLSNRKKSVGVLIDVLSDRTNSIQLRSHAAEALGNLRAPSAVSTLEAMAKSSNATLKRNCIYALQQIASTSAKAALTKLKK